MTFFLKAKHWQLFFLFVLLPVIFQWAAGRFFTEAAWTGPLGLAVFTFLGVAYLWTLGDHFYDRIVPEVTNLKPAIFHAGLVFAFIELMLLGLFADFFIIEKPQSPIYIVPLHMVAMVAIFYAFYYVAKSISTVEIDREANLNDFAGPFFMLWFFPIGVWFLQPKVNRLAEEG